MSMCLRGSNQEQINLDHCSWLVTIIRTAHTHTHIYIYYSTSRLHAICSMFDTPPPICTLFAAFGRHSLPFARYLHPHFTLHTPIPTSHYTYTFATQQSTFFTPHTLHSTLFRLPQSTVQWYGNRGNMYKTVQISCFTKVFYVTAFRFVGCIVFF